MLGRVVGRRRRWWRGERRRHSLTCTGTTPAVTFPPTCLALFAAEGEGRAGGRGRQVWGHPTWAAPGWGLLACKALGC